MTNVTQMDATLNWLNLAGKVCVVTGAASGIGAAIAELLAQQGVNLALVDRNIEGCQKVQEKLSQYAGKCQAFACDVSDEEQVLKLASEVEAQLGCCELLVNAAGILRAGKLSELDIKDWNSLLNVNLTGYLLCGRTFAEQMKKIGGGSIVNIGSISGHYPQPNSGAYSSSKAGVSLLSQQMAIEWGEFGIRSNVVAPGMILTELTATYYDFPGVKEKREAFTASKRIGKPEDIANSVLFLLSDKSSYVNGTEIGVDGGLPRMLMGKLPRPGFSDN